MRRCGARRSFGLVGLGELNAARQHFLPNDPTLDPLWSCAEELGLALLFHGGYAASGSGTPGGGGVKLRYSRPIYLDDVAADHPSLRIVCAHPSWPWESEALAVAMHKANVYLDLSGWAPKYFSEGSGAMSGRASRARSSSARTGQSSRWIAGSPSSMRWVSATRSDGGYCWRTRCRFWAWGCVSTVSIIDTTLRDGQQSLWAYRMRTAAMVPTLRDLDEAGFEAIEFVTPGPQFARMVRDLKEDPWRWVRAGVETVRRTPLRIHGSVASRLSPIPESTQHLMLERLAGMGIRTTRASDPWNDFDALDSTAALMAEHGIETVYNLVYTVSPRHTVEYFAEKARDAASRSPHRICLKDVGGLMTVEAAHQVMPAVVAAAGDVPLEFHVHCSNGFGPYLALLAVEYGITVIHTAVPPLADGDSQPSVFSVVDNLRARGHSVDVDLERLRPVSEHLESVRRREGFPVSAPRTFDSRCTPTRCRAG